MSGFAVECFHEISQVLAKPLFFLVNVELLNVIYHFLLQTSEIDIHLSEFGEIVLNPGTNLADAFIFITRHLCQQVLYLSYALGEELFEFPALFASVFHQGVGSSVGRFNERGAFVLLVFGRCFGFHDVRQPHQKRHPVGGVRHSDSVGDILQTFLVGLEQRQVELSGGVAADVLYSHYSLDFASFDPVCQAVAHLQFHRSISRG